MQASLKPYFATMRIWQWAKNLVVFTLPLGSGLIDSNTLHNVFLSFMGISLISSSIYIVNDLNDISVDSLHPIKKNRPIASKTIKVKDAILMSNCLLFVGLYILYKVEIASFLLGVTYFITALGYTFKLKYLPYIDSITISSLFIFRLLIGGYSANISPSVYLAIFIFFSSFGIAVSKRISILKDKKIDEESRYLKFLKKNYSLEKLKMILKSSFWIAFIIYFLWVIMIIDIHNIVFIDIFLFISILGLGSIFSEIYNMTMSKGLEDFVFSIIKNKKSILTIIITCSCVVIRLFVNEF